MNKKKSNSEKFIDARQEEWNRLEILIRKKSRALKNMTSLEIADLPHIYRRLCSDVETAQTLKLSPDTIRYINTLVKGVHSIIYSPTRLSKEKFIEYFTVEIPRSFLKNLKPILFMTALFFGTYLTGMFAVIINEDLAYQIIGEEQISRLESSYSESITRSRDENLMMAGFYIKNNISIAFFSFIGGITFGILSLYLIAYNGIVLGVATGFIVSKGYSLNFFAFTTAHSALELLGICIAGGTGLALGLSMIKTKEISRARALIEKGNELVPIVILFGILIFLAALVEGFISAQPIPYPIKATIAIVSLIGIVFYGSRYFVKKSLAKHGKLKNR